MQNGDTMSFSTRRVNALIKKEFFQIIRDPSTLLITIFLPLLLMFLYGSGVSLDLDHLKVGLVMEDNSPIARSFADALEGSTYFDVKEVQDIRDLKDDMTRGKIRGIFVIPSYFTNYFERFESCKAPVQVIADGSETNTANFVLNYANGVFRNFAIQNGIDAGIIPDMPLLSVEPRFWFNEKLKSRNFLLSGSLSIIMAITGSLLTALVVAREWERGTMEALFSTTVTTKELVAAKIIPYFFLGMISMIMCILISIFIYDVPLRGSFLALLLVSAIFLICSLALGLMISTMTKNQVFAYQITLIVAFLPAYILSGFLFEITSMPTWIQYIADFIAAKYFVQSLQTIFLVGNVWELILKDMIPIILLAILFFSITAFHTRKRLD
jgi:ABC-2 type transport system permease protein